MFQRRHYNVIAEAFAEAEAECRRNRSRNRHPLDIARDLLVERFQQDNPNFQANKFVEASGGQG